MKISYVSISGMHNAAEVTYNFNQLNYLYGKNGAGKSTALQATQLALLGYIPGLNKTKEAIFRHCRKGVMIVELGLQDGDQQVMIRRTWHGSKSSVHSGIEITPSEYDLEAIISDIELPIFNFNDLVSLSANKMKDWFVGFLPKSAVAINWEDELKKAVGETPVADENLLPETLKAIHNLPGTGVEIVRAANAYIKQAISFKKSEVARMQSTIQSLVYYDDVDANMDVEEARKAISDLNVMSQAVANYRSAVAAHDRHKATMDMYADCVGAFEDNAGVIEMRTEMAGYEAEHSELQNKLRDISAKRQELAGKRKQLQAVIASGGVCTYTKKPCASILEMIEQFRQQVTQLDADIEVLDKGYAETNEDAQALEKKIADLRGRIGYMKSRYSQRDMAANAMLPAVPEIDMSWLTIDFNAEIQRLSDNLAKCGANKQYNSMIDALTSDKYKAENALTILKLWDTLTGANGLQTRLMDEPFKDLAAKVDVYIHALFGQDVSAHFVLSEKANSFSFGLMRNDKYIPYDLLSSGEKCMYSLALMSCIVASAASPLKVILVDDLLDHLDDGNIDTVFDALKKVEGIQFILAGVKPCNHPDSKDIVIPVGAV